jgi:predicted phosphoadenosine phosphosulfate sulfurtransferase
VVVAVSGGKDSSLCLELSMLAAQATGRLPIEVCFRDEEIAYPGTYEYLQRQHDREGVNLRWLVANQPILNAFDREMPYWWVFDPLVDPDLWVSTPPDYAEHVAELDIANMITKANYPVAEGQDLVAVIGIRTNESSNRLMGLHSQGGFMTGASHYSGVKNAWPIYDWTEGDVWLAYKRFGWDYNSAYDVMHRMGTKRSELRIGPPTMNIPSAENLRKVGALAWPQWFDRVCRRLPTVRTFAKFGKAAIMPQRRAGELWSDAYQRLCIDEAPDWIAERATVQRERQLTAHANHSSKRYPQREPCTGCTTLPCWMSLTNVMYLGDPFGRYSTLGSLDPQFFRVGAGTYGPKAKPKPQVRKRTKT